MGTIGAQQGHLHGLTPRLSVSLSPEGANCWSQGCERPTSAKFQQTNTVWPEHCTHDTDWPTNTQSHTETNNTQLGAQTKKKMIFVPLRSISLSNSVSPMWHFRSHNGLWHQPSHDHNEIQLRTLSGHNGPLFAAEPLPFFCLISRTKRRYRSTNWAWTIAYKGVTDLMFPALLPTVPHSVQRSVNVNWQSVHREIITTWLCGTVIDLQTTVSWISQLIWDQTQDPAVGRYYLSWQIPQRGFEVSDYIMHAFFPSCHYCSCIQMICIDMRRDIKCNMHCIF